MIDRLEINVQVADKTILKCKVEISRQPPWKFLFSGLAFGPREYGGRDLFEAMIALRKELQAIDCLLLCAGARTEVFPSGMCREAGGRKAYKTTLGLSTNLGDLVDIFEYADQHSVATVEQQLQFHKRWLASLGQPSGVVFPLPGEIDEARRTPNGWVYRIAGMFGASERVPPEAIVGAWKVDALGNISGEFIKNSR